MGTADDQLGEIFAEALTRASPEERERFLAAACGPDAALRRQVDSLLEAHAQAGDYLQQNVIAANGAAAGEGPGSTIGRYKLLQHIGEGGFGVVFMAEQLEPVRRRVALKVLKAGMDTQEVIARFEAERQALALMDHPNIARVLDGGVTAGGRPYFVMDLVKGVPITEFCDRHQLPVQARLKLFMQVCAGVQHAHQKGVIHRDLKPTNVLVTLHDGEPVPKVIDFGIAKAIGQRLTNRTLFTRYEQLIGTPAYMSPEQAEWSGLDVDTRSDLYSLGVLLYELLTGTTPLEKETLARAALDEVRRMIREVEPPKPSTRLEKHLASGIRRPAPGSPSPDRECQTPDAPAAVRKRLQAVRGDLDWVVMKCLEKDRTRRYETVNGLARDLERHLNGEPVVARPPSKAYLAGKFIRRHRVAVATSSAVALALVLGLGLALVGFTQARLQRERAQASERAGRRQLVQLELQEGTRKMDEHQHGEALAWYGEALRNDQGDPLGEPLHRMRIGSLLANHPRLIHLFVLDAMVWRCAFGPDGRKLAAWSGSRTGTRRLSLFDLETEQRVWELQATNTDTMPSLSFSADGRRILVRSFHRWTGPAIYEAETGRCLNPSTAADGQATLLDSLDGRTALLAVGSETALVIEVDSGKARSPRLQAPGAVLSGRLTRDLRHAALLAAKPDPTNDSRGVLLVFDVRTGSSVGPPVEVGLNSGYLLAEDGRRLIVADPADPGGSPPVGVWNVIDGSRLPLPNGVTGDFHGFTVTPTDQWVIIRASRLQTAIWSVERDVVHILDYGVLGPRRGFAFSPDGVLLAWDDWVRAFPYGQPITPQLRHGSWVYDCAFSPDGHLLATASTDHTLRVWDLATAPHPELVLRHRDKVTDVVLSPDGKSLATQTDGKGAVRCWSAETGKPLGPPLAEQMPAYTLCFSPDSRFLASYAGEIRKADPTSEVFPGAACWPVGPTRFTPIRVHTNALVHSVAFSPDSTRLVTAGADGVAAVWDAASGAPLLHVEHDGAVHSALFSPDGRRIATAAERGPVRVWDARSGQALLQIRDPEFQFDRVAFTPDGRHLVTGGTDQSARVWDAETGRPASPALFHAGNPVEIRLAPDSASFCTFSPAPFVKVWDLATAQLRVQPLVVKELNERGFTVEGWILDAEVSPTARFIVACSGHRTARVWDSVTGEPIGVPFQHAGGIYAARFTPQEDGLVTAGADGSVRVHRFTTCDLPLERVQDYAELLAGARKDATGAFMPLSAEQLAERFHRLRTAAPEAFRAATPQQQALWHDEMATLARTHRRWASLAWHLDRALLLDPRLAEGPTGSELVRRRGEARAELGDFSGALADFARAVELDPDQMWTWYDLLAATVITGRLEQYRAACARMLRQFEWATTAPSRATGAWVNTLAYTCTFAPAAVPDMDGLVKMTDALMAAIPEHPGALNTYGQVLYRAGRFEDAIRTLDRACVLNGPNGHWADALFLAMAHARLGHGAEVRRCLSLADECWAREVKPGADPSQPGFRAIDLALFPALRREAAALVIGDGE